MRIFNLYIDSVLLVLYLQFTLPIIRDIYSHSGTSLPDITVLFLNICIFWKSFYFLPIAIYAALAIILNKYTKIFDQCSFRIMIRVPILLSLIGSMIFLALPIMLLLPMI